MEIDIKELKGKCDCGKEHNLEVRDMWIEAGAIHRLPDIMKENSWFTTAVIADENTWQVAGEKVNDLLNAAGISCISVILPPEGLHANERGVSIADAGLTGSYDVLIAAGSGTIHDITRYIAHERAVPFISVPTAASVDGYVSTVAAMTLKGCKKTISAVAPLYLLADTDVFKDAPQRLTASGFGDLLGKYTAIADWKIANMLTGEYICEKVIRLTEQALAEAIAAPDNCERLMYGLILSGLAMQMVGNSRPASGGEHHLSHFWEMEVFNGPLDALHGEKVGVGLLLCSEEYHRISDLLKRGAVSPSSVDGLLEEDLRRGFPDTEMRELLIKENTPDPLEGVHGSDILANKDAICSVIDSIPTVDELSDLLRSFGGKLTMGDIGLDPALKNDSLRFSPYIRSRLTMMRLRKLIGFAR